MAYPYDYDNLEVLDYEQCSIFSASLTDGFIGNNHEIILGTFESILVKYGTSENPKLDIMKMSNDVILSSIAGVKKDPTIFSFDIFF